MTTIEILITTFFAGIVIGSFVYRQTMTTKKERDLSLKHNIEQTAFLEDKIKEINDLEKRLNKIIRL